MKRRLSWIAFSLLYTSMVFSAVAPVNSDSTYLHTDWVDTSVSPAQDFFTYANGVWLKNNPIPKEYSRWGTFNILNNRVEEIVHKILIKASLDTKAKPGSIEQKIGDFYYSGMDEDSINLFGIAPLLDEFNRIDDVKTLAELQMELAHLHNIGVDALFNFGSMQDFKNSTMMVGAIVQGGLGLPNRDYYLKTDDKFKKIRQEYLAHISKIFQLLDENNSNSTSQAQIILDIETKLATASMSQIEQRDPYAIYHMKTLTELDKTLPNFSWSKYLIARGQPKIKEINDAMPEFFKAVNNLLSTVSLNDWKTYLRWHLIDTYAPYLSKPFVEQNFKMVRVLTGVERLLPRWKRVVGTENAALGFAIGKIYVDTYFPPQSKAEVLTILKNIREVFQEDIQSLNWMSAATRKEALKKLTMMEERIGYPEKWRDYSSLEINRGPYVSNVMRANAFLAKRDLDKIGKPADRSEWAMNPQTINAYYDPSMNNLNMPAGILQSPFFDPKAPAAVNYGSVGFILGHEMTHGFDDEGALFDGSGNLKNWWLPQDLTKFKKATQCIVDQFSSYLVNGDMHVQGKLVSGEATADLGGLSLAYKAFHHSKEYQEAKTIDGWTPDQQFFLGAAHIWATNIRPEALSNQVVVDPHAPAQFRVNGTFANMPEFQAAFNIPANSPMVNPKRCNVW